MSAVRFVSVIVMLSTGICHADDTKAETPKNDPQVRDAIRRSLPYIRQNGVRWMKQRKCVACHRISFQVWSHRVAERAGLAVDAKTVDQWAKWAIDWRHWMQPKRKTNEIAASTANVETMAQLILGHNAGSPPDSEVPEWAQRFRDHLLRTQQKDGAWKPNGQLPLQRRPLLETAEVSTMWAMLALQSPGLSSEETATAIDRATKRLASAKPGVSTEWWATRLLVMQKLGRKNDLLKTRTKLLSLQNPDGGWGWLHAEKSDAFGTGLAIYALSRLESERPDAAITQAREHLLKTQQKNGSWSVPSSRKKDKRAIRETSRFWGTTWAVIGLAESLPAGKSITQRAE